MSADYIHGNRTEIDGQLQRVRAAQDDQFGGLRAVGTGINLKQVQLNQHEESEARKYRRPAGWLARTLNRRLGPLPTFDAIIYDREEFAAAPSYRVLAALTALVVPGTVVALTTLAPVAGSSPVSLVVGSAIVSNLIIGLFTALLLVAIVVCVRHGLHPLREFVFQAALDEEQWFRTGAESWSKGQRIYSCVSFGFAHIINLVYTFLVLGLLMLVGGLFMWVYLRQFHATGDVRKATIASAKFHAHYNIAGFGW